MPFENLVDQRDASIDASVVITTRNRRDETFRAVSSALAQEGCRLEVLVFDDASEDGTAEALQRAFPDIRVFADSQRKGYIHNRNRGFQESSGRIVFSIDDDAYFSANNIVVETLRSFATDGGIGAVAIPYIEPLNTRSLSTLKKPFCAHSGDTLRGYIGCAHAVRRDVVLSLGGYREFFIHQGEERDLCLRMMAAGWRIVYGSSKFIVHMVSPKRQAHRVIYYGARNQILFDILNLPLSILVPRLLWDVVAIIRYRFSLSTLFIKLDGIVVGFLEGAKRWSGRCAVSRETYNRFVSLPSHGPEEWGQEVPSPCIFPPPASLA